MASACADDSGCTRFKSSMFLNSTPRRKHGEHAADGQFVCRRRRDGPGAGFGSTAFGDVVAAAQVYPCRLQSLVRHVQPAQCVIALGASLVGDLEVGLLCLFAFSRDITGIPTADLGSIRLSSLDQFLRRLESRGPLAQAVLRYHALSLGFVALDCASRA